jgi:hypothetical protein
MKKLILSLTLLLFAFAASAQDVKRDHATMEQVQAVSDRYLFASASAESIDKAKALAVQHLASQIMTEVKVRSNYAIGHQNENGQVDEKVLFNQVSETFTNVRLTDYQTCVVGIPDKRNKNYTVFVYIGKDKVKEIYQEIEEREKEAQREREKQLKNNVNHYYNEGCKAVKDVRIGDALKYWYWSYVLSIGTNINIEQGGKAEPASRLVETQIEKLLNAIRVTPVSFKQVPINDFQNKYQVTLNIEYVDKGVAKKVTNLDYSYNDGITSDQRGPRVRDGKGILDLQYEDIDEVDFYITYRYDESETPPEIYEMVKAKGSKNFVAATKRVAIPSAIREHSEEPVMESEEEAQMIDELAAQPDTEKTDTVAHDHKEMLRRIEAIEAAIRTKDYASVKDYFTEEGYESFNKLVKYGKASIVGKPQYRFLDFGPITLCRSITMQFSFLNNKKSFIEDVTFRFNADNLVESLAFTLSDVAEADILGKGNWDRDSRLMLMTFLEDYQTAYALGRIDYLERIFSEQALIIVGNKLVQRKIDNDRVLITESVKYDTLSKTQYMRRLREHFGRKKYINLNFTDTDFERSSNGKNFYGIRVRQEYFSDTYGDVGYLFLLVDLRFDEPIIHVRAWQNDKVPMEDLFGLSDLTGH